MISSYIKHYQWRSWVIGIGWILLASVLGLWAFNTVADLAGIPAVQYRHAVAAITLLFILRWFTTGRRYRCANDTQRPSKHGVDTAGLAQAD
jgi:hypothetical protein